MNVVMTVGGSKGTYIQFRVREDLKDDIRKVATARGLSVSGLIHSLLVKAIREEKAAEPDLFAEASKTIDLDNGIAFARMSSEHVEKEVPYHGEMTDETRTDKQRKAR